MPPRVPANELAGFLIHSRLAGPRARANSSHEALTDAALAGHQNLATTQRYMHASRWALDEAIQLLENRGNQRGTALSSI